jgi:hypothetical protein
MNLKNYFSITLFIALQKPPVFFPRRLFCENWQTLQGAGPPKQAPGSNVI